MQKLTDEICEKFDSAEEIQYQELKGLPYLHAVIEEGLRICPPNPGLIPRVVVDRNPGHLAIGDHVFPPGVRKPPISFTNTYPSRLLLSIPNLSLTQTALNANHSFLFLDRNRSLQPFTSS